MSPLAIVAIVVGGLALIAVIAYCIWKFRKPFAQDAGFLYDPSQDIFYSAMDAWQRRFGYCQLYDEAAPLCDMILDCEPVRFEYEGKRWLIELWKGQYGMAAGAEVGVFNTADLGLDAAVYSAASEEDMPLITFELRQNNQPLFTRSPQPHWWLTGFILGHFAPPEELAMKATLQFGSQGMANAVLRAFQQLGYSARELGQQSTRIQILFTAPKSAQPQTRTPFIERASLNSSREYCRLYHDLTDGVQGNALAKLRALADTNAALHEQALRFGRSELGYRHQEVPSSFLKNQIPPS